MLALLRRELAHLILVFFDRVYPIYPFLDRASFEGLAFGHDVQDRVLHETPWMVLYTTIIALGLLYHDGGSFNPFDGNSWQLFAIAMKRFHKLLFAPKSLMVAQVCSTSLIRILLTTLGGHRDGSYSSLSQKLDTID